MSFEELQEKVCTEYRRIVLEDLEAMNIHAEVQKKTRVNRATLSKFFYGEMPFSIKKLHEIFDKLGYDFQIVITKRPQQDE